MNYLYPYKKNILHLSLSFCIWFTEITIAKEQDLDFDSNGWESTIQAFGQATSDIPPPEEVI